MGVYDLTTLPLALLEDALRDSTYETVMLRIPGQAVIYTVSRASVEKVVFAKRSSTLHARLA